MPRYSKKRTSTSSPYRGISHHKICVISSIDKNDNLLLQITGLGRYTTQMLKKSLGQKLKTESYSNVVINDNYINLNKIFSIDMPINLNIAYSEYTNQS